jgi:hypothetical protein
MMKSLHIQALLTNFLLSPRACLRNIFSPESLSMDEKVDAKEYRQWMQATQLSVTDATTEKVFLMASFLPFPYCLKIEGVIARTMKNRGYSIVVLTNQACRPLVEAYHEKASGFKILIIEEYLSFKGLMGIHSQLKLLFGTSTDLIKRVKAYHYRGANLGQHALATVSAQTSDGRIRNDADLSRRLYRALRRSILLTDAAIRIVEEVKPSKVLSVEKGFVGTCEIFCAALAAGVDYVQWCSCHEPNSVMLKRYNQGNVREHPFSISNKGWRKILEMPPLSDELRQQVVSQFERGYLQGDWFKYKNLVVELQQQDREDLIRQLELNPEKKTAVIYSHILNDANLFYGDDLFEGGYEEWLVETVKAAQTNNKVNWVLKLHPANVSRNAKSSYIGEFGELVALKLAFGVIPDFLRIVYPNDKTSPFSFFKITDYGITVRGTVGMELPCFGIPTLTAGSGRYSNKGFTIDSASAEEYINRIKAIQLVRPMSAQEIELGLRHAYFSFKARPARYDAMFTDVYKFPLSHSRYRDIEPIDKNIDVALKHPQMERIVDFLCSSADDYFDLSH